MKIFNKINLEGKNIIERIAKNIIINKVNYFLNFLYETSHIVEFFYNILVLIEYYFQSLLVFEYML